MNLGYYDTKVLEHQDKFIRLSKSDYFCAQGISGLNILHRDMHEKCHKNIFEKVINCERKK